MSDWQGDHNLSSFFSSMHIPVCWRRRRRVLLQRDPHVLVRDLLELVPPLPPHLGRVHVGRALGVGLGQHAHDGEQDLLDRLDGAPALGALLVAEGVVAGRVEDGDADAAVGVDVGVEDLGEELHLGRVERVVLREGQAGDEHAVLEDGVLRA